MSNHLTDVDFEDYLQKAFTMISEEKLRHLETCPECKAHLNRQMEMDELLKGVKPLAPDPGLFMKVFGKIRYETQDKPTLPATDWFFISSIMVLAVIVIVIFMNHSIPDIFSTSLPYMLPSLEQQSRVLTEKLPEINLIPNIHLLPNINFSDQFTIFIVALLVVAFYFLLDKIVLQRYVFR